MKLRKIILTVLLVSSSFFIYEGVIAYSSGITGRTKKTGGAGCSCHGSSPTNSVSVTISGPASVKAGDTATYRLKLFGGPLVAGGCDIAAQTGTLSTSYLESQLQLLSGELTHTSPKLSVSADTIRWTFKYKAPNAPNTKDSLYAVSNSVNNTGNSSGDAWNFAGNFVIDITPQTSVISNTQTVEDFSLSQNFPNPFNPSTKIEFNIPKDGIVSLRVYDISGKEVAALINGEKIRAGYYTKMFNGANLSSGTYLYVVETDGQMIAKKMALVK